MVKEEYLFIETAHENRVRRVIRVNGKELPNWKSGPQFQDYANQLGEQGWHLIAYQPYGGQGVYWIDLVFSRTKG